MRLKELTIGPLHGFVTVIQHIFNSSMPILMHKDTISCYFGPQPRYALFSSLGFTSRRNYLDGLGNDFTTFV